MPDVATLSIQELAEELRHYFRVKVGVCEAESAMAREIILLQLENERLREQRHRAFYREAPNMERKP